MPEVDILLGELEDKTDAADTVPETSRDKPAVTKPGDLWQIGSHFLLCGDSTKAESYQTLLRAKRPKPYSRVRPDNVPIAGNVSGLGKNAHQEFAMASGEMTPAEFTAFLATIFQNLVDSSIDGSLHYICMDWRHMREVLDASVSYSELKNLCVWAKTNAGMGALYRSPARTGVRV